MDPYLTLARSILDIGERRETRNAVTTSLFAEKLVFDMRQGFPLLTTKKMPWKAITGELETFLEGSRALADLHAKGCHVWDANAQDPKWLSNPANREPGNDLGRFYGTQWRHWPTHHPVLDADNIVVGYREVDQIRNLIDGLRSDPYGRRHIVTAYNPAEIDEVCLPPCHVMFQCYCTANGELDLQMYQRSADYFLGVPFNIASYGLLLEILAAMTRRQARYLTLVFGDVHVYQEHEAQLREQLDRTPRGRPQLAIMAPFALDGLDDPAGLRQEYFHLLDYDPHPPLKAEMIV